MSFNFQCSPMYNNQNHQVIGYMCNSNETHTEGFENSTPSLSQANITALNNYKTVVNNIHQEIQLLLGQRNSNPSVGPASAPALIRITDNGFTDKGQFTTHFPSPTQIIFDSRNATVDAKGNGNATTGTAPSPKIGSTITGPFVQPGTTVTAVENISRMPSNPYIAGQTITLNKPLQNIKEDKGIIFVYSFSN